MAVKPEAVISLNYWYVKHSLWDAEGIHSKSPHLVFHLGAGRERCLLGRLPPRTSSKTGGYLLVLSHWDILY